jgi:hypothetical protein
MSSGGKMAFVKHDREAFIRDGAVHCPWCDGTQLLLIQKGNIAVWDVLSADSPAGITVGNLTPGDEDCDDWLECDCGKTSGIPADWTISFDMSRYPKYPPKPLPS